MTTNSSAPALSRPLSGLRLRFGADGSQPIIDGFRVRGLVGTGSKGHVFLADQRTPMRVIALKVMTSSNPDELAEKVLQWAQSAGRLDHPGLVPMLRFGQDGPLVYIASRYIDGPRLLDLLNQERLTVRDALRLVIEVLRTLDFLHSKGFCHGDLRPSNIVLDPQGKPMLTDVMLSIRLQGTSIDKPETRTAVEMVELGYQPPQQRLNRSWIGKHADLYAIGALLYHGLTGLPPVIGEALQGDPQDIDGRLDPIIGRLLSMDPADRYLAARETLEDLITVYENLEVQSDPARAQIPAPRMWHHESRVEPKIALYHKIVESRSPNLQITGPASSALSEATPPDAGRSSALALVSPPGVETRSLAVRDSGSPSDHDEHPEIDAFMIDELAISGRSWFSKVSLEGVVARVDHLIGITVSGGLNLHRMLRSIPVSRSYHRVRVKIEDGVRVFQARGLTSQHVLALGGAFCFVIALNFTGRGAARTVSLSTGGHATTSGSQPEGADSPLSIQRLSLNDPVDFSVVAAARGDGRIMLTQDRDGNFGLVEVVTPENHHLITPLSSKPVAISAAGKDGVLIAYADRRRVIEADLTEGRIIRSLTTPIIPTSMVRSGDLVIVGGQTLSVVWDPVDDRIRMVAFSAREVLTQGNRAFFVSDTEIGVVDDIRVAFDPNLDTTSSMLNVSRSVSLGKIDHVCLSADGQYLTVLSLADSSMRRIRVQDLQIADPLVQDGLVAGRPVLDPRGRGLWIPTVSGVRLVDETTGAAREWYDLGPGPKHLVSVRDGIAAILADRPEIVLVAPSMGV